MEGDGKKKVQAIWRGGVIMETCVEGMQNIGTKRRELARCSKLSARGKWERRMVDEGTRGGKEEGTKENE